MTNVAVHWYVVSKEDLLDVLLGEYCPHGPAMQDFPFADVGVGKLALGYREAPTLESRIPPAIVAVGDESVADTMSWLRVYAGEVSPISQFARVMLASDWRIFGGRSGNLPFGTSRPERWASVAVGEALSQLDGDPDLQGMPLSRVSSCFSIPVGRAALLFGQGEATHVCVDRLRAIGADRRLGRRSVSVDQLLPVWAIAGSAIGEYVPPNEAAVMVMEAATDYIRSSLPVSRQRAALPKLEDYQGLYSDSVEERVMAFNRLSADVLQYSAPTDGQELAPTLAAAAFLVGRSTSHVFLLKRLSRIAPTALAWFGVIAALSGPRAWDMAWLRAAKGAERILRQEFCWVDAPSADIGWGEFSWLAGAFTDLEPLVALPKMLPRTLGIEVIPGALIQVRLGGGPDVEPRAAAQPSPRERALQDALAQFLSVAHRVRGLVNPEAPTASVQQTPGLFDDTPTRPKAARTKRKRSAENL